MKCIWGMFTNVGEKSKPLSPMVEKLKKAYEQLSDKRIFNCCIDKLHTTDRDFDTLDVYEYYYNCFSGPNEAQAELALLFMKQYPNCVLIAGVEGERKRINDLQLVHNKLVEKLPLRSIDGEVCDVR